MKKNLILFFALIMFSASAFGYRISECWHLLQGRTDRVQRCLHSGDKTDPSPDRRTPVWERSSPRYQNRPNISPPLAKLLQYLHEDLTLFLL